MEFDDKWLKDEKVLEAMSKCDGEIIDENHPDLLKFDEKGNMIDKEGNVIPPV
ncbi:MAG: hypothetical protein FWC41_08390 [Firmicutes bacterium]|nr:hypothetical protein [Bacillota bacterium]